MSAEKREARTQGRMMTRLNAKKYIFWSKSLKNTRQGVYFQLRCRSLAYKLLPKRNNSQLIITVRLLTKNAEYLFGSIPFLTEVEVS